MTNYPDTIYVSPQEWGSEESIFDATVANDLIASLQELGPDWELTDLADAAQFSLIQVFSGEAIYNDGPNRIRVISTGGGYYELS